MHTRKVTVMWPFWDKEVMGPTELNFEVIVCSLSDDSFKMTNFASLKQMPMAELVAELNGLFIVNEEKQGLKEGDSSCLF